MIGFAKFILTTFRCYCITK